MKYSKSFERDFKWYLSNRKNFTFSGDILRKKNKEPLEIIFDRKGLSGKESFHLYDSTGVLKPTRHTNLLQCLLKTKASINFQIKEWAKDRATGYLPGVLFSLDCIQSIYDKKHWSLNQIIEQRMLEKETVEVEYLLPNWVINATEQQKFKYY